MDAYPPIAEHGLIGDLQTAALVSTDGTIDWFCFPRFDGPSVFAGPLDRERGGHFRIAASSADAVVKHALARSGRLEQARTTLEKMFTYANQPRPPARPRPRTRPRLGPLQGPVQRPG